MTEIDDSWKKKDSIVNRIKREGILISNYPTHHNFCEGNNFEGSYLYNGIRYDLFIIRGWLKAYSVDSENIKTKHIDREDIRLSYI